MTKEGRVDGLVYLSTSGHAIASLVFVFDSTDRRINQILRLSYSSKYEMKTVGGAAYAHESKMIELGVLGMAKVVEDLLVMFRNDGFAHDIWRDFEGIEGVDHAQMIRRLANRIKHHESYIVAGSHQDADALIEQFGFPNNMRISDWSRQRPRIGPNPCPYFNLYRIQCFCIAAVNHHCGTRFPVPKWDESEASERLVRQWLGDFLDIEAKSQSMASDPGDAEGPGPGAQD